MRLIIQVIKILVDPIDFFKTLCGYSLFHNNKYFMISASDYLRVFMFARARPPAWLAEFAEQLSKTFCSLDNIYPY